MAEGEGGTYHITMTVEAPEDTAEDVEASLRAALSSPLNWQAITLRVEAV
jgi:hypothetical protein